MNEKERDLFCLNLILQQVKIFEENDKCDFSDLDNNYLSCFIEKLYGLINALETVDKSQINKFISEWGYLEIIYAVALDQDKHFLNEQQKEVIMNALRNLSSLIIEEKLNHAKQFKGEKGILAEENWIICPYCFEPLEPPQIDLVLICPKCSRCFHNPLKQ